MKLGYKILLAPVVLAVLLRLILKYEVFGTKFSTIFPMAIYTHFYLYFKEPIIENQPVVWKPGSFRTKDREGGALPNILLILVDDLGFNDLSGGCGIATPNIDSIRHNGVSFANAYSGQATCAPSRAALLTGRFPTRFGSEFTPGGKGIAQILTLPKPHDLFKPVLHQDVLKVLPPMSEMVLSLNETMFSNVLQDGGYDTYHIGKWDCGPDPGYRALERGFNETLSFNLGGAPYLEPHNAELVNGYGNEFDDFLRWVLRFHIDHNNGPFFQPDKYMTDYLTDRAVDLITTRAVKKGHAQEMDPFFLSLAYNAPHNPYQALRSDYEDPEVQKLPTQMAKVYAAMIKSLDRGIGKVLQSLKDANLNDNTIVIFTSDNGGANYAGLPNTNHPYRGWKGSLFEGGIHVPMFIQWPSVIKNPTDCVWDSLEASATDTKQCEQFTVDSPVGHVDLFTSFASLVRTTEAQRSVPLAKGVKLDGLNIFDLVRGAVNKRSADGAESVDAAAAEAQALAEHQSRTRTLYWRSGHYKAVRVGDWKLQVAERPDKVWLHHLLSDPFEWRNLALEVNVTTQESLYRLLTSLPAADAASTHALETTETAPAELYSDFIAAQLQRMHAKLVETDNEQVAPRWPAASESPVLLDKDTNQDQEPGDEYVYWAN